MIKFLRSCFSVITYVFFALGGIFIGNVIFPVLKVFSKNPKKTGATVIQKAWFFLIKYLEFFKIIKVNYDEEISNISNKIIVASHPTYIDIVILIALIPNSVCIVKNAILKNPVMKNIAGMLYISNDSDIEEFKKQSKEFLEEGFNIIIFPTGKRTEQAEEVHIHKGAALISIENNIPVVPIKITSNPVFLPKDRSMFDWGEEPSVFDIEKGENIFPDKLREQDMSDISLRNKICELIKEKI